MPNDDLNRSLAKNLSFLKETFGSSIDFYYKPFRVGQVRCCLAMFTGLSSPEKLTVMALSILEQERIYFTDGPTLADHLLTQSRIPTENAPIATRANWFSAWPTDSLYS